MSLLPVGDRWQPILNHRLHTERWRARALAARLGLAWQDPTVWADPNGDEHPIIGMKIRIVLERILIVNDSDPWLKGAGEIDFEVIVHTDNNGGFE